jgi:hypothetical protein
MGESPSADLGFGALAFSRSDGGEAGGVDVDIGVLAIEPRKAA